jgi:hypothetical protein
MHGNDRGAGLALPRSQLLHVTSTATHTPLSRTVAQSYFCKLKFNICLSDRTLGRDSNAFSAFIRAVLRVEADIISAFGIDREAACGERSLSAKRTFRPVQPLHSRCQHAENACVDSSRYTRPVQHQHCWEPPQVTRGHVEVNQMLRIDQRRSVERVRDLHA